MPRLKGVAFPNPSMVVGISTAGGQPERARWRGPFRYKPSDYAKAAASSIK